MAGPPQPSDYNTSKHVELDRSDAVIAVGFNTDETNTITKFYVGLLYYDKVRGPDHWHQAARFDHDATDNGGHDIYEEGLHVDMLKRDGSKRKAVISDSPPSDVGFVVRSCVNYFKEHYEYFITAYRDVITWVNVPEYHG